MCVCVCVCVCERERESVREGGGGGGERLYYIVYRAYNIIIQSVHDSCILQELLELAETLGPAQNRGLSREGECMFMWCWLV